MLQENDAAESLPCDVQSIHPRLRQAGLCLGPPRTVSRPEARCHH